MVSPDVEYTMLKEEILGTISACDNLVIAMYTITIAVLAIAFETDNYFLFLLPFIILFSFQGVLNRKRDNMVKLAAYIAVYLEEEKGWESKVVGKTKIGKKSIKRNKLFDFLLGRSSSMQLGILCAILFYVFYINENKSDIRLCHVIVLVIVFLLCVSLGWMNRTVLFNISNRNAYILMFRAEKNKEYNIKL